MECNHLNCKREATQSNYEYFNGIWYCTYHANKATKAGRIERKLNKKKK